MIASPHFYNSFPRMHESNGAKIQNEEGKCMKSMNVEMVCADLKFERHLKRLAEAKKATAERKKKAGEPK